MASQVDVATELANEVTKYEALLASSATLPSDLDFERISYIRSRWNNSAAYYAFAGFILILVQQFITRKFIDNET